MFRSKKEDFGNNSYLYTLENDKGLKVKLAEVGATITGIFFFLAFSIIKLAYSLFTDPLA